MGGRGTRAGRGAMGVLLGLTLVVSVCVGVLSVPGRGAAGAGSAAEPREGFVVALAEALCLQPTPAAAQRYSDVAQSYPDFGYIAAASAAGWIRGFPDGTFQPQGSLTREQMAKIVVVALGLQAKAQALAGQRPDFPDASDIGRWAWGDVDEATAVGVVHGLADGSFDPVGTFTTAQAADVVTQLAAYLLKAPTVTAVTPGSGTAGASVTVAGTLFCHATGVAFGQNPASSFTVGSLGSLTAVAPPGSGTVDVTVTTGSGTSATSSQDHFTYIPAHHTPLALTGASYDASDGGLDLQFSGAVDASALASADFELSGGQGSDTLGTLTDVGGSGTLSLTVSLGGQQLTLGDEIQLAPGQTDITSAGGATLATSAPVPIRGIPALVSATFVSGASTEDLGFGPGFFFGPESGTTAQIYLTFTTQVQTSGLSADDLVLTDASDSLGGAVEVASGSGTDLLEIPLSYPTISPGDGIALAPDQRDITDGSGMPVQPSAAAAIGFAALQGATYVGGHQLVLNFGSPVDAGGGLSAADFAFLGAAGDELGTVESVTTLASDQSSLVLDLSGEEIDASGLDAIAMADGQTDVADGTTGHAVPQTVPVPISTTYVTGATYTSTTGQLTLTFSGPVNGFTLDPSTDLVLQGSGNLGTVSDVLGWGSSQLDVTLDGADLTSSDSVEIAFGQHDLYDGSGTSLMPTGAVPIQPISPP